MSISWVSSVSAYTDDDPLLSTDRKHENVKPSSRCRSLSDRRSTGWRFLSHICHVDVMIYQSSHSHRRLLTAHLAPLQDTVAVQAGNRNPMNLEWGCQCKWGLSRNLVHLFACSKKSKSAGLFTGSGNLAQADDEFAKQLKVCAKATWINVENFVMKYQPVIVIHYFDLAV